MLASGLWVWFIERGGKNVDKCDLIALYFAIASYEAMNNPYIDDLNFTVTRIMNLVFVAYLMSRSLSGWLFLCGLLAVLCFVLIFPLKV